MSGLDLCNSWLNYSLRSSCVKDLSAIFSSLLLISSGLGEKLIALFFFGRRADDLLNFTGSPLELPFPHGPTVLLLTKFGYALAEYWCWSDRPYVSISSGISAFPR